MAPAVVLVLALLAPAFSLPFTIPEYTPGSQTEQQTSVSNNLPQIQPGFEEKTGVQVPSGCSAGYPVAVNQDVVQTVTRVLDAPVNVEQAQVPQTETLFLPPQPAPVTQVDQIVRPVIVPAEAIASGRVIIMAVEPIQQRAFPDVIVVPQPQQPIVSEIPIQQVQSVEKQTPYLENQSPLPHTVQPNEVPQRQSQVNPERQTVKEQTQSSFYHPQVTNSVEPAQRVQTVEAAKQEHNVQPTTGKQSHENPHQVEPVPHQQVYAAEAVPDNVQKQVECAIAQSESEPQQRVNVQEVSEQTQQSETETHHQQSYSVQPEQIVQENQSVEPQQQVHQQVPQVLPVTKTESQQSPQVLPGTKTESQQSPQVLPVTKTENQQVQDAPQQVNKFATGQTYSFGDKLSQQQPAETSVHEHDVTKPIVVKDQ